MTNYEKSDELLKRPVTREPELAKYQRMVTVLCSNISGSTIYFDEPGDRAWMTMKEAVNDVLLPLVQKFNGVIVKTIGGAIMAYWENPVQAVRCALEMQGATIEINKVRSRNQQIRIRVALALGVAVVKDNDVFGKIVKVCARIHDFIPVGKIGVSPSLAEAVSTEKDFVCRPLVTLTLRGEVAEPMQIYEVLWREGEASALR
jgi:class 3 adenylate cyclase